MDIHTTGEFHTRLMKDLAAAIPFATQEEWAERWDNAREQFAAMNPRNAAEAQLAAFAIAAMAGAMDNFRRAAEAGTSAEKAGRLRGSALAAGRFYASVYRNLSKAAAKADRPANSPPAPIEPVEGEPCPPGHARTAPGTRPVPRHAVATKQTDATTVEQAATA